MRRRGQPTAWYTQSHSVARCASLTGTTEKKQCQIFLLVVHYVLSLFLLFKCSIIITLYDSANFLSASCSSPPCTGFALIFPCKSTIGDLTTQNWKCHWTKPISNQGFSVEACVKSSIWPKQWNHENTWAPWRFLQS